MSKRADPALIGVFVVAALAILVATIIYFGSGKYGGNWYRFNIYFQGNAAGLQVGAPVVLKGVSIGQVSSVQVGFYPEDEDFIVPVVIDVDGDRILWSDSFIAQNRHEPLQKLIEQGLRARLDLQSIVTGQLRVDLGFYPETAVVYRGRDGLHPEIPSIPSAMDELIRALQDFPVEKLTATSLRIAEGLDRLVNSPKVTSILDELHAATVDVRSMVGALEQQTLPAGEKIAVLLEEVRVLVRDGRALMASLQRDLDNVTGDTRSLIKHLDTGLEPAIADMRRAAASAGSAFNAADNTFKAANEMIGSDSPLRYELLTLMRNLSDAARSLKTMADYLERHPDALVRGKR
ncbi:MAG: MCE family protein [Gammaproteobacteria bacterium]|nr:MCE family protein [Gammaproteobacteria bacterium]